MIKPIINNLQLLDKGIDDRHRLDGANNLSFAELLKDNLAKVNQLQQEADKLTQDFTLGKIDNIHEITIATEKAQLALNLTIAIQNKVIDAYKEIMHMQI